MGEEEKTQEIQGEEAPTSETSQPETPPVNQPVTAEIQPPPVQLNVDPNTALNITAQEFDKKITEAEAVVADLKKQKAAYIYDTNIQMLLAAAKQAEKEG